MQSLEVILPLSRLSIGGEPFVGPSRPSWAVRGMAGPLMVRLGAGESGRWALDAGPLGRGKLNLKPPLLVSGKFDYRGDHLMLMDPFPESQDLRMRLSRYPTSLDPQSCSSVQVGHGQSSKFKQGLRHAMLEPKPFMQLFVPVASQPFRLAVPSLLFLSLLES